MKTDWFKDVNPGLDRLTEILGMGKPSHGYTIAEKAPEVVTAPGVYFPAKKGEVIPLEAREKGGEVNPTQHGDKEHRKLAILESIVSMVKPMHLESRAMGGLVVPPEPMKLEQSKYDILKSAISILKPPAQQKSTSGEKKSSGEDIIPLESRQMGGEVDPSDQPLTLNTLKSLLKPKGRQSYNERTSAYGSPAGKSMFSGSSSGPDLYDRLKAARGSSDMTPSVPGPPTGMANLPTTGSYSMKPDALKSEDILDLSKDKEGILDIPTIPRQAGGAVTPPTEEDEMDELRRRLKLGPPTTAPVQFSSSETPESLELAAREKWAQPGYPEKRLAEMKETLGPGVFSVSPGFQRTYYEAHPEERLMDEITAQNKPTVDMYQKLIEEERTKQQGYGRGFGPTSRQRRLGAKEPEYGKNIPELTEGLRKTMALPEETLGAVAKGKKTSTTPAPHLVQTSTGEYVWATPGGVLPAGIMGKTTPQKEFQPHSFIKPDGTVGWVEPGKEVPSGWKPYEKPEKPGKPEQLSMTDIKSAHSVELSNIKNQMMIDMTPDEQANISGQPGENILALLLSGKIGKSLGPEKKKFYRETLQEINSRYGGLINEVLGRKGAKLPEKDFTQSEAEDVGSETVSSRGKVAVPYDKSVSDAREAIKQGADPSKVAERFKARWNKELPR